METRTTTRYRFADTDFISLSNDEGDRQLGQKRLDALLVVNAENSRRKNLYKTEREKTEAELMRHPLVSKQVFAYFGLILGVFSPTAIFVRLFVNDGNFQAEELWFFGILAIVNLVSAVAGYFSGKIVGDIVGELEKLSWTQMLIVLPFIGLLWGMTAGGAGGMIIFLIGALFGGFFGAAVGAVALPALAILHRLFKKGDKIERRQFLPLAFGTTFVICAYIISF